MDYRYVCGVDVGGTFTDLVLLDLEGAQVLTEKVPTTPEDPSRGMLEGIGKLMARIPAEAQGAIGLIHATTLVTNALIERRGARVALLTTAGFADILDFRRENRFDIFDLAIRFPEPLVPAELRFEVAERLGPDGREIVPLDADAVRRAARAMQAQGVEAVAIGFLHAYQSDAHEQQAAALIREEWPAAQISLSGEVAPFIREYERLSTTTVNAYGMPIIDTYLGRLETQLRALSGGIGLHLMVSSGGICSPETARRFPVRLLESGPVAGALVAGHFAREAGRPDVLAFDMGGTTAKLCVMRGDTPEIIPEFEADRVSRFRRGSGLPVLVPSVDLVEIGAGGGSIAGLDQLGLLQVGPQSSGAVPGPACYGRGGDRPTVTDADLTLGFLNPDFFLGGRMKLDTEAARRVIEEHVGRPLGVDVLRAAWGIHDLVNENMANAAWLHMAEKGLDPRTFTLVATGGAAPLHACQVAAKLGVASVLCPSVSGVASAFGLTLAPPRADIARSYLASLSDLDMADLEQTFVALEAEAAGVLVEAGTPRARVRFSRTADMLYRGQTHHVEVAVPADLRAGDSRTILANAFHEAYARIYGASLGDVEPELVALRATAVAEAPAVPQGLFSAERGTAEPGTRPVYDPAAREMRLAAVHALDRIEPGVTFAGPALIESEYSTIVVPPDWSFHADPSGVICLTHKGPRHG